MNPHVKNAIRLLGYGAFVAAVAFCLIQGLGYGKYKPLFVVLIVLASLGLVAIDMMILRKFKLWWKEWIESIVKKEQTIYPPQEIWLIGTGVTVVIDCVLALIAISFGAARAIEAVVK